jgi:hypothetical protein
MTTFYFCKFLFGYQCPIYVTVTSLNFLRHVSVAVRAARCGLWVPIAFVCNANQSHLRLGGRRDVGPECFLNGDG